MPPIDLTPFGFTQTENLVYDALTGLGPASGYAVAKAAGIARANAYQALNGLVAKGAAVTIATAPLRFRAVRGDAILARVTDDSARRLDALEQQIRSEPADGADAIVPIVGMRALIDVAVRLIARSEGVIRCIAPGPFLHGTTPGWRKRLADGAAAEVWALGAADDFPLELAGEIDVERVSGHFDQPVILLHAPDSAISATVGPEEPSGHWTSDPSLVGCVGAAIAELTG
ncbi:MAG TPA: helix-turn-helix domain-containing protein [Gemmatimonadales bacterium]|jgi:hypothetical protein|nr:helix-turn-helix domain-containing protein [Gemmatimonadales bacterium]